MLIRDIISYLLSNNIKIDFFGNQDVVIDGFCSLDNISDNKIVWVKEPKNVVTTIFNETNLVISSEPTTTHANCNIIITDHSKRVFFDIFIFKSS